MTNETKINSVVAEILQKFDLIMISDYMNESLILLKNELGWEMDDILYFTINKRYDHFIPSERLRTTTVAPLLALGAI